MKRVYLKDDPEVNHEMHYHVVSSRSGEAIYEHFVHAYNDFDALVSVTQLLSGSNITTNNPNFKVFSNGDWIRWYNCTRDCVDSHLDPEPIPSDHYAIVLRFHGEFTRILHTFPKSEVLTPSLSYRRADGTVEEIYPRELNPDHLNNIHMEYVDAVQEYMLMHKEGILEYVGVGDERHTLFTDGSHISLVKASTKHEWSFSSLVGLPVFPIDRLYAVDPADMEAVVRLALSMAPAEKEDRTGTVRFDPPSTREDLKYVWDNIVDSIKIIRPILREYFTKKGI